MANTNLLYRVVVLEKRTMTTSNRVKERIGINLVSTMTEVRWECGWQEYGAANDDAIDGVIIMRKGHNRPTDTGGLVFVQVKCGGNGYRSDQLQYPNHVGVQLGKHYIDAHKPRWQRTPGPAVLIFVDDVENPESPPAWWVDLNRPESYSPTNAGMILIPKNQKFTRHSKGDFHRLCGVDTTDRLLESISLERADLILPKLSTNASFRDDAWNYYKKWREDDDLCRNPTLGFVMVNRVGWKHITRKGRLPERIMQSWSLLSAAKKMVSTSKKIYNLGHAKTMTYPDGVMHTEDYLGLRANVIFPHRHQSVVQVVLKRARIVDTIHTPYIREKIWFYSVYELRRGIDIR